MSVRNTKQLIEVKRGAESDIRVALIRKMITIIRDNVSAILSGCRAAVPSRCRRA
jgi:hypothetical protein